MQGELYRESRTHRSPRLGVDRRYTGMWVIDRPICGPRILKSLASIYFSQTHHVFIIGRKNKIAGRVRVVESDRFRIVLRIIIVSAWSSKNLRFFLFLWCHYSRLQSRKETESSWKTRTSIISHTIPLHFYIFHSNSRLYKSKWKKKNRREMCSDFPQHNKRSSAISKSGIP